ncbi:hypothetical protein ACH4GE_42580, partial [Streptomyces tendae]
DVELGARILEVVRGWERDTRLRLEDRKFGAVKPFPTGTEKAEDGKFLLGAWLREQAERINPGLTHVDLTTTTGLPASACNHNWWGARYPTDLALGMLLDGLSVLRYEERLAAKARLSGAAPPRRADVNDDGTFKYGAWLSAQQAKIGNVSIAAELFTEAGLKRDYGLEILDGRKYPRSQDHQALMDALEVLKRRAQVVKDSLGPSGAEDYAGWLWGRMEAQLSPEQLAARSGGVLSEEQVNGILNAQFDPSAETRQAVAEVLRVFDREVRLAALERESGPLVLGPEGLEGLTGGAWRKAYAGWLRGQMATFVPRLTSAKLAAKVRALDLDYTLSRQTVSETALGNRNVDYLTRQGIAEALRVLQIEARSEREQLGGPIDLGPEYKTKDADGKWASAGWLVGRMERFNPPLTVAALVDKVNKLYPKTKVSQSSISQYRSGIAQPLGKTRVAIAKTLHALEVERGMAPAPWGQGNAGALGQGGGGSSSAGPVGAGVQRYSGLEGMGAVGPRMGFQAEDEVHPERGNGGASAMEIDGGFGLGVGLGVQELASGIDGMFGGSGSAGGLLGGAAPGSGAGGGVSVRWLGDADELAREFLAVDLVGVGGSGHSRVVAVVPNEAGLPVREGKVVSPEEAVAELLEWVPEGEWAGVPLRWVAVGRFVDRDFVEQVTRLLWRAGKPAVMVFEDPEVLEVSTGQVSVLPPSELDRDFGSWLGRWLDGMMPPLSPEGLVTLVAGLDEATLRSVLSGQLLFDVELGARILEAVRGWERDARRLAGTLQLGAVKRYPTGEERDDDGDFLLGAWLREQMRRIDPNLNDRDLAAASGVKVSTAGRNLGGRTYPLEETLNKYLDGLSVLRYEERLAAKARLSGAAPPQRSDVNPNGTFKYGAWLKAQLRKIDPEPDEVELFTAAGLDRSNFQELMKGEKYPGATTQRAIMDALGVLERRAQAIREALGPPGAGPYAQWLGARMEQGLLDPQQLAVRTGGVLTESRINDILAAADDPTPQEREDIAAVWRGIERELRVQMLELDSGARLDLGPEEGQGLQAYADWLRGQMGAFTPPLTPAKLAAKARNLDLDYRVYARVVSEVLGSVRSATPMTRLGIAEALRVFEMEARSERERLGGPLDLGPPEGEVGADGRWAYATWLGDQMAGFKPRLMALTLVNKIKDLFPNAKVPSSSISRFRNGVTQPSPESRQYIAEALRVLRREAEALAGGASSAGGSGAHGPLGGSPDSGVDPLGVGWPVGREVVFEGPRWGGVGGRRPVEVVLGDLPVGVREVLAGVRGKGKGRVVEPEWFRFERRTSGGRVVAAYEVSGEGGIRSSAFEGEVLSGLWLRAGDDFFLPGGGFVRGESGWLGRVANGEFYGHPEFPGPGEAEYRLVVDRETASMYFVPVGEAEESGANAVRIPLTDTVEEDDSFEEQAARALTDWIERQQPAPQTPRPPEGAGSAGAAAPVLWLGDEDPAARQGVADTVTADLDQGSVVVALRPNEAGLPVRDGRVVSPEAVAMSLLQRVPEGAVWHGPVLWQGIGGWIDRDYVERVTRLLWRAGAPVYVVFDDAETQQASPGVSSMLPPGPEQPQFGAWLERWLDQMDPPLSVENLAAMVGSSLDGVLSGRRRLDPRTADRIGALVRRWESEVQLPGVTSYPGPEDRKARGGEGRNRSTYEFGPWLNEQRKNFATKPTWDKLADEVGISQGRMREILRGGVYPNDEELPNILEALSTLQRMHLLVTEIQASGLLDPQNYVSGNYASLNEQFEQLKEIYPGLSILSVARKAKLHYTDIRAHLGGILVDEFEKRDKIAQALEELKSEAPLLGAAAVLEPDAAQAYAAGLAAWLERIGLSPEELASRVEGLSLSDVSQLLEATNDPGVDKRKGIVRALRAVEREARVAELERNSGLPLYLGPRRARDYRGWLAGEFARMPSLTPAALAIKGQELDPEYMMDTSYVRNLLSGRTKPDSLARLAVAEALRVLEGESGLEPRAPEGQSDGGPSLDAFAGDPGGGPGARVLEQRSDDFLDADPTASDELPSMDYGESPEQEAFSSVDAGPLTVEPLGELPGAGRATARWLGDADVAAQQEAVTKSAGWEWSLVVALRPGADGRPVWGGQPLAPEVVAEELLRLAREGVWAPSPVQWVTVGGGGLLSRDYLDEVLRLLWRRGHYAMFTYVDAGTVLPPVGYPGFGEWLNKWLNKTEPPLTLEEMARRDPRLKARSLSDVKSGQRSPRARESEWIVNVLFGWERDAQVFAEGLAGQSGAPLDLGPTGRNRRGRYQYAGWLGRRWNAIVPKPTRVDLSAASGVTEETIKKIGDGTRTTYAVRLKIALGLQKLEREALWVEGLSSGERPDLGDTGKDPETGLYLYADWLDRQLDGISPRPTQKALSIASGVAMNTPSFYSYVKAGRILPNEKTRARIWVGLQRLRDEPRLREAALRERLGENYDLGPEKEETERVNGRVKYRYGSWLSAWRNRIEPIPSRRVLADLVGLSQNQIQAIEEGVHYPRDDTRVALVEVLRRLERDPQLGVPQAARLPEGTYLGPDGNEAYGAWLTPQYEALVPKPSIERFATRAKMGRQHFWTVLKGKRPADNSNRTSILLALQSYGAAARARAASEAPPEPLEKEEWRQWVKDRLTVVDALPAQLLVGINLERDNRGEALLEKARFGVIMSAGGRSRIDESVRDEIRAVLKAWGLIPAGSRRPTRVPPRLVTPTPPEPPDTKAWRAWVKARLAESPTKLLHKDLAAEANLAESRLNTLLRERRSGRPETWERDQIRAALRARGLLMPDVLPGQAAQVSEDGQTAGPSGAVPTGPDAMDVDSLDSGAAVDPAVVGDPEDVPEVPEDGDWERLFGDLIDLEGNAADADVMEVDEEGGEEVDGLLLPEQDDEEAWQQVLSDLARDPNLFAAFGGDGADRESVTSEESDSKADEPEHESEEVLDSLMTDVPSSAGEDDGIVLSERRSGGARGGSRDSGVDPFGAGWPIGRGVVVEGPELVGVLGERPAMVLVKDLPEDVRAVAVGVAGRGKGKVGGEWLRFERGMVEGGSRSTATYRVSEAGEVELPSGVVLPPDGWVRFGDRFVHVSAAGPDGVLYGGGVGGGGWLGEVANAEELAAHSGFQAAGSVGYRLVVDRETESMYLVPMGSAAAELGAKAVRIPLQGVVPVRSGRVGGVGEGSLGRVDRGRGSAVASGTDSGLGVGGGGLSLEEFELVRGVVLAELRGRWGFEGV